MLISACQTRKENGLPAAWQKDRSTLFFLTKTSIGTDAAGLAVLTARTYFTRAAAIACSWVSVRAPRLFIWPTPVIAALICAAVLFALVVVANGLWQVAHWLAYSAAPSGAVEAAGA